MASPNWLDPAEQKAWRGWLRTHSQVSAVLGRELARDSGLSIQDYAVLVELSESPEGRMRAFELGRSLTWEKSRLSHHIARMIDRGLVTRVSCPSDLRGSFVAITPLGLTTIAAAAPKHAEAVRRYFVDQLTPGELKTLTKITGKVERAIDKMAEDLEGDGNACGDC
jgi:DNA-binding MarR family transcriptional regulator